MRREVARLQSLQSRRDFTREILSVAANADDNNANQGEGFVVARQCKQYGWYD